MRHMWSAEGIRSDAVVDSWVLHWISFVEVLFENEPAILGALADSVEEVVDLEPDQIQAAPRMGTQIRTDFIKGMGKRDMQFIMILDIDRVFSAEELTAIRNFDAGRTAIEAAA